MLRQRWSDEEVAELVKLSAKGRAAAAFRKKFPNHSAEAVYAKLQALRTRGQAPDNAISYRGRPGRA